MCILTFLLIAGCSSVKSPSPEEPSSKCLGDIDGNGVVSVPESQAIAIVKYSSVRPSDIIVDGTEYTPEEVVLSADFDGSGLVNDAEFSKVILNRSYGCKYSKDTK